MSSYFFCNTNISSEMSTEYSMCNSTSGSFCYPRSVNAREAFSCLRSGVSMWNLTSVVKVYSDSHVSPSPQNSGHLQLRKATAEGDTETDRMSNLFHFILELTKGQSFPFLTSALGKLLRDDSEFPRLKRNLCYGMYGVKHFKGIC